MTLDQFRMWKSFASIFVIQKSADNGFH